MSVHLIDPDAVNLPQEATIIALAAWYVSSGGALTFRYRNNLATGATDTLVFEQDFNSSETRKPVNYSVTTLNVVANSRYSYGFGTCISGTNERFTDARITYTYTNAGD